MLLTSNALFHAYFDRSPCSGCRASFTESGLESIDEPQCKPDVTPGVVIGRNIHDRTIDSSQSLQLDGTAEMQRDLYGGYA